jgi:NitT/TauT family transport system substrate-binding protein
MTLGLLRKLSSVALAATFSAGIAAASPAFAADTVSLRLDWKLSGYHLPFYWAKEKGYYSDAGIDVDIKEGAGSDKTVALIDGKHDDIGVADFTLMATGIAKGMKLKGIYCMVQTAAWAVISYEDDAIKKPQDLSGRSVAMTAGHKAIFDLMLKVNNVSPDDISFKVTSPATRNTTFVNGQVESFVSVVIGSPLDLVVRAREGKGKPVYFMPFSDFGVSPLSQGIVVHEDLIASKPDMLKKFVAATARAQAEVAKPENLDEAVDIAMRLSGTPEERRASVGLQWGETLPRFHTVNSEGKPLGWMSEKDWDNLIQILIETDRLENTMPVETFYTNDFISKG